MILWIKKDGRKPQLYLVFLPRKNGVKDGVKKVGGKNGVKKFNETCYKLTSQVSVSEQGASFLLQPSQHQSRLGSTYLTW